MKELDFDQMFEKETKVFDCEKHGKTECEVFSNFGDGEAYCYACEEEQKAHEEAGKAKQRLQQKLERCGVSPLFMGKKYADFQTQGNAKKEQALAVVKDYANEFSTHLAGGNNLILIGGLGTGKTHLASCLAKQLAYQSNTVALRRLKSIIREVRTTWKSSQASEDSVFKKYSECDLLIIDEVGVGSGTDDERNIAYEIIDRRYNLMLPTVVISNCNTEKMGEYIDERSVDRLLEKGKVLAMNWKSHRRAA